MANTVAYPDLALEKFIGIDSSEDPTAFIRLLEKKINFSLGSRPTAKENGQQTVYDHRRKAFFGSVLRGPAAEWLDSSDAALTWEEMKTQFKNIYRKVYTTVRKANHRSLMYRNKYKLAKPLRVGQKVLLENHQVPFGKSQKLCELRSGPYTVTKVITKVNYEVALDSDPMRIQVVHRNHLIEFFPRDTDSPTLLSNYEKPVNDDRTEHFYNEYAKNRLSELNQPIERQHIQEYLPIFPDAPGPSRMNTTFNSPAKCGSTHSTPNS